MNNQPHFYFLKQIAGLSAGFEIDGMYFYTMTVLEDEWIKVLIFDDYGPCATIITGWKEYEQSLTNKLILKIKDKTKELVGVRRKQLKFVIEAAKPQGQYMGVWVVYPDGMPQTFKHFESLEKAVAHGDTLKSQGFEVTMREDQPDGQSDLH